ncbi:toxic anion resistance protein [Bacillus thermotolerans]|mgnify:CR=1 FL=1|uniref:Tellurite resistance protein n=1 Tax=Bacillus thermotolerans TaxID=1221996 RepID=A0A0F5I048_BACTR|nr:Tellurite resistance protein [Bacillus thermotolerans]KKB39019.1 Tellurite resistance protein [Bacillus thermotolerans]KKB40872.1 Tellurite resistance protein [Bacillus thermotolerans]
MAEENMKPSTSLKTTTSDLDDLLSSPFGESLLEPSMTTAQPMQNDQQPKRLIDVLPEEHRIKAEELAKQIDPTNHQSIISYGTTAQSKLSNFSHSMLDHVQQKDIGTIGDILNDLMSKLKQVNPDELKPEKKNVFSRLFNKVSGSVQEIMSKYQKVGTQIDRISVKLGHSKQVLMEDIQMLEQLYEKNKEYFQALNVFIAAGELKLEELEKETIPALRQKAEQSGDQMAYQDVNDMMQFADRLEKRLHDLKLSRQITIQSAPQIRMIQNMNQALAEKIQSSILTAIPLWKNQVAIALTLVRQQKAMQSQKQVSQTTNDLLLKNSEMLKTNTIETAKENERGLVDIDTLKKTQSNLISTLEETLRIQHEGRTKRRQAEQELASMENELKQKLLDLQ